MKVKWKELPSNATIIDLSDRYPGEFNPDDLVREYEGEVISTVKPFLSDTRFIVKCTDNKVREVPIFDVTIVS